MLIVMPEPNVLLEALAIAKAQYPEFRVCQILVNECGDGPFLFYVTDQEAADAVYEWLDSVET